MRRMRDSPPELERLFPTPYASSKATERPVRCRRCAVQAPNTPAPITTASYASANGRAPCRFRRSPIGQVGRRDVLHRHAQRFEDGDLAFVTAAQLRIRNHLPQLRRDVTLVKLAFQDTLHHVAGFF